MKDIKLLFLATILLISCSENEFEKAIKVKSEIFSAYISQCDTSRQVYLEPPNTAIPLILDKIKESKQISLIYLVDAECSTCIVDFIACSAIINCTNEDIEVYGIVNENQHVVIDYYLDLYQDELSFKIHPNPIVVTKPYPFGNLNNYKNVFLLQGGKVIDNLFFCSGNFIY